MTKIPQVWSLFRLSFSFIRNYQLLTKCFNGSICMILLVFTTNSYLASVTRRLSNFGDAVQWEDVEKKLHNCSSQRSWCLSSLDVHCSHHFTKKEKQTNKQTPCIKKPTIAQLISVERSNLPLVAERSPRISWSRLWANPPIIPTFDCLIVSPLLTVTSNNDCALLKQSSHNI